VTDTEVRVADELRGALEVLVRVCSSWARSLERYVAAWPEESEDKKTLLGDIEQMLKITERAQKVLALIRKEKVEVACKAACETFAAAILEVMGEPGSGGSGGERGPADDGRRSPG
jgi:hypothetical protein